MTFRRFSKRRRRAALIVALIDRLEWGPPIITGAYGRARQDGICAACSGTITADSDYIVPALTGPPGRQVSTYIHEKCPNYWDLLRGTVEEYDDVIVSKINNQGRGRAGCGHEVEGEAVYLVREPKSLQFTDHSKWMCEACVTPGGSNE